MEQFATYKAYTRCKLYKRDSELLGTVKLEDGGRTLSFDAMYKYAGLAPNTPTSADFDCALKAMNAPAFVSNQISNTRALDGRVTASWGKISASWTYHPDSGLDIGFYSK